MKKILIIHNKYRLEGGEDIAIQNELKVLKKNFETHILYFDNEIESYVRQFFYFLFNKNKKSIKKILTTIESFNPDLIYLHNTWFKISPGIFKPLINVAGLYDDETVCPFKATSVTSILHTTCFGKSTEIGSPL